MSTVVSFAKIRPLFSTFTKIARKKMFNPNPIFPSKKDFSDSGNEVMPLNVVSVLIKAKVMKWSLQRNHDLHMKKLRFTVEQLSSYSSERM